jgi:hypothetical protein
VQWFGLGRVWHELTTRKRNEKSKRRRRKTVEEGNKKGTNMISKRIWRHLGKC